MIILHILNILLIIGVQVPARHGIGVARFGSSLLVRFGPRGVRGAEPPERPARGGSGGPARAPPTAKRLREAQISGGVGGAEPPREKRSREAPPNHPRLDDAKSRSRGSPDLSRHRVAAFDDEESSRDDEKVRNWPYQLQTSD